MPLGKPRLGGGIDTTRVFQAARLVGTVSNGQNFYAPNVLVQYFPTIDKWLATSAGAQNFDRGKWWMSDNPFAGQWEPIPNVPFTDPATDWLWVVGAFRDRFVFCNRTGSTYRWYQVSLDFSTWTEIGSMQPFSGSILGAIGHEYQQWGFLPDTLLGDIYIVQGSSGTAQHTFWWTNDLGATWFPYNYPSIGTWQAQGCFGNMRDTDNLPGERWCMLGSRQLALRVGAPVTVAPLLFATISSDVLTVNTKAHFLSLPDGRTVITDAVNTVWYSLDFGQNWQLVSNIFPNGFGFTLGVQGVVYDEPTDGIIFHSKFVNLRTQDFSSFELMPAIAANDEPSNDGDIYKWVNQQGNTILVYPKADTTQQPLRAIVRV